VSPIAMPQLHVHNPPFSGAHHARHDETDARRKAAGQRGPGAGEGPWYHAAPPQTGAHETVRRKLAERQARPSLCLRSEGLRRFSP
jgi:hypothetical protein